MMISLHEARTHDIEEFFTKVSVPWDNRKEYWEALRYLWDIAYFSGRGEAFAKTLIKEDQADVHNL